MRDKLSDKARKLETRVRNLEHKKIEKVEGSYYFDDKGNKYIDAISSWWVNLHGHSHPHINKNISEHLAYIAQSKLITPPLYYVIDVIGDE